MINKAILVGRVGKDPQITHLDNGTTIANFTLATNKVYKNRQGEKVEDTQWHQIVLWRGLAEVAEKYVKKGDLLYVEGENKTRSWEDKDNKTHYTTEIIGSVMQMLGGKSERQETPPPPTGDDLPF